MAKWEFYDEYDEVENEDQENASSMYEFKKWLESNNYGEDPIFQEGIKKVDDDKDKNKLKDEFKKRVTDRVNNNIEKRLKNRKKKN